MAFMGMFMAFLTVVLVILGVSAFLATVCFVVSGIIMVVRRKKNKDGEKVKQPWYVITLRIFGVIFLLPIFLAICAVIIAFISNSADKKTNLARAVMSRDYDRAEMILENGADPDVKDEYGRTLLMCIAARETYISAEDKNRYEYVSEYNREDPDGEDMKMMAILLEHGADIDATVTDCGDNKNHEYEEGGWTDIYANSEHQCGNTALFYAVRYRSPEMVEFLIDNGADVNVSNACGFTPLLICADTRNDDDGGLEIASELMDEGASPRAVTNFHQDISWLLYRRYGDNINEMKELIFE